MKPFRKAILFLLLLTFLEIFLRKGFIGQLIPISIPPGLGGLLVFTAFAVCAWFITKRFAYSDQMKMGDLGISFSKKNQLEFYMGLIVGVALWGIVALSQSIFAGFSWILRPDFNALTLIHGLFFIFIADLGTELYMRGYPLIKLEEGVGVKAAIGIMVLFELLKGFVFNIGGDLLFYAISIPVLHTIFFSIIYFKTRRLGASLGVHTGANFITISIFDLRIEQSGQVIPAGLFQADTDLENLSIEALQMPWLVMAGVFCFAVFIWWNNTKRFGIVHDRN